MTQTTTPHSEIVLPGDPPFFQNEGAEKLIVFIHGLTGDPQNTWTSEDDEPFFWPEQLANDPDFENSDVLSFGYTSVMGKTLNIPQIAQHLETTLNELKRFKQYQSISFVAHSLGGLVTRQYILDHFREIKIDTVILLSTPNFGNRMAKITSYVSNNAHLEQLDPGEGKYIDGLNDHWRKEFREKSVREPFRFAAGYELFPMYKSIIKLGIIVEKYAAVNFASHTQAFEDDHEKIAKAKSKSDPKYIWVRQQLLDLPRDPRNREYSEAEEKRFEHIIDELQKELKGTDLEEAFTLVASGKLDEALKLLSKNEENENQQVLEIAKTRFVKGQIHELKLEYNKALEYYEKALQLLPEDSENLHAFDYLNAAGNASRTLEIYDQAIRYYQKALAIGLGIFRANDIRLAAVGNNIGEAWGAKKNYNQAILYYKKALEIEREVLGPAHPNVAVVLNNIADVCTGMGEYDMAIDYLNKALEICMKAFGPDHPSMATYLNNMGEQLRRKGDYDNAINYYEKALAIVLKAYGPDYPRIATHWGNLGAVLVDCKKYDKALENFEKSLEIKTKYFGPDHPSVAIELSNLGTMYIHMKDDDKAIDYFEKALAISGHDSPNLGTYLNNLGAAWLSMGEYDKALGYLEKATSLDLKKFGPDHPGVAVCWTNLGKIWSSKKGFDKAIYYFEKALAVYKKANLPHRVSLVEENLKKAREAKAKGKG